MKYTSRLTLLFVLTVAIFACNDQQQAQTTQPTETATKQPGIKEENISYSGDGTTMKGYIAFDSSSDVKR
ncbi:MAG TPA: dienelactone hydrolase family protein, partial [Niastella sp.]